MIADPNLQVVGHHRCSIMLYVAVEGVGNRRRKMRRRWGMQKQIL